MDDVEEALEGTVGLTFELAHILLWTGIGFGVGLFAAVLVTVLARVIAKRRTAVGFIRRRTRTALMFIGAVIGSWAGFIYATQIPTGVDAPGWRGTIQHLLLIAVILGGVWLVASLIRAAEDVVIDRLGDDTSSGKAKRVQTQSQIIRRVAVAIVVVLGVAAILLTFPGARAAGASILASAGIASVVAGMAAQSTLGSVFAGLQIAMTDALRVDDAVFVEEELGKIEEITLTYVVVRIWDGRRIVVPTTYFTTTPFENWTRRDSELLGSVEMDLDWRVPVAAMRAEMERLLEATELWDERLGVFQVMDATGGLVRVRALVSAEDVPTRADLLSYLREHLLLWLQANAPYAMPRTRLEQHAADVSVPAQDGDPSGGAQPADPDATELMPWIDDVEEPAPGEAPGAIFTGSPENEARGQAFSGPGEEVLAEREQEAERRAAEAGTLAGDSDAPVVRPGTAPEHTTR